MSLLRTTLIAFSRNRPLQQAIVRVPVSRRMARRFVAGEDLQDALAAVQDLNERGMHATLDHLGENVTSESQATADADEYLAALDALYLAGARSHVSVKLTQMGLDLGEEPCYENVSRVVRKAAERGTFVRIDMEDSSYTERTLAMYRRLRQEFTNVGVAVQSCLRRTQADVEELIGEGIGHFRVVKGAYDEPESVAYRDPVKVTEALKGLVRTCLLPAARAQGTFCAVASHDESIINFTRAYAYQNGVPNDCYEFQMLYGIRRELQAQLVRQGYPLRIYVPYGTHWYPYFMRRLAERPANLLFFMRALAGD